MRLSRRILLVLVAMVLVVAMFVVAGLDVNGSIFIPSIDTIIGATVGAVIVSALLTEALRLPPQTGVAGAIGSDISIQNTEQSAATLLRIAKLLADDNAISRTAGLRALKALDRVSNEMANAYRDLLQVFIRQTATREEMSSPYRRIELELAIASWASLAKRRQPVSRPLDLSGLLLDNLRLQDLSLVGANLANASLVGADITGSDFSGADFSNALAENCNALGARFKLAIFSETNLTNSILAMADMSGAMLRRANMSGVSARTANFTRALLAEANLDNADLSFSNLAGAMLVSSNLSGATFTGATLAGAAIGRNVGASPREDEQLQSTVSVVRDDADLASWLDHRLEAK